MSLNDITHPTRRGFMRNAFAAVASPILPKGALAGIGEIAEALPDLSGYALKEVPKKLVPFMTPLLDGMTFLTKKEKRNYYIYDDVLAANSVSIIPNAEYDPEDNIHGAQISDFVNYLDPRVRIPERIDDQTFFCMGHIFCDDNFGHNFRASTYHVTVSPPETIEDWMDIAKDEIDHAKNLLKDLLSSQPDIGTMEDIMAMPVSTFYNTVTRPRLRRQLALTIEYQMARGDMVDIGLDLSNLDDRALNSLKKDFPEWAKKFDEAIRAFEFDDYLHLSKYNNSKACHPYPPGHFHMEKHGMGKYTLHTPEIKI